VDEEHPLDPHMQGADEMKDNVEEEPTKTDEAKHPQL